MTELRDSAGAQLFRLLRYGGVGIAVSVLYSGIVIAALSVFGMRSPTIASSIGFLVTLPVSFYAHRSVSFHEALPDRRQAYRFALIAVASFIVAVGGMRVVTEVWKLHYVFGILIAWILVPATNFIINSLWVFPLPQSIIKIEDESRPRHEAVP